MDTKELSHCCGVYVYNEFSSWNFVKEWQERGLKLGKDFKPLAEVTCCSACSLPCSVIHEMKAIKASKVEEE